MKLRIFNDNPWAGPLNWGMEATHYGEPRMPFAIYVRLDATGSEELSSTFPGFQILPAELRIHILSFCDAQTLFQLMHVSSATRAEAKKLFWSLPDAWYHIYGGWLLRSPSNEFYAAEAQTDIQQVEVDFFNGALHEEHHIHDFWQTLLHRFPRATRVVISEPRPRKSTEVLPPHFQRIVRMAPEHISVYASINRTEPDCAMKLKRSLWRRTGSDANASPEGNWEEVTPLWTRQSILLPPRKFCGPVGAFENALYQYQRYRVRENATRLLLIEAIERHHFDGRCIPFTCFQPECGDEFKQRGEWAFHAVESDHDVGMTHPDKAMQTLRDEKRKTVEQLALDASKAWDEIAEYWGKKGSEKRQTAEQAFLHQLENDPVYSQGKGRENEIWESMSQYLGNKDRERESKRIAETRSVRL